MGKTFQHQVTKTPRFLIFGKKIGKIGRGTARDYSVEKKMCPLDLNGAKLEWSAINEKTEVFYCAEPGPGGYVWEFGIGHLGPSTAMKPVLINRSCIIHGLIGVGNYLPLF